MQKTGCRPTQQCYIFELDSKRLYYCSAPPDCVAGHQFIFVVPKSALEPAVASPGQDSQAPCTLRRLTSDPEVYIVPLDGCGANKHVRNASARQNVELGNWKHVALYIDLNVNHFPVIHLFYP